MTNESLSNIISICLFKWHFRMEDVEPNNDFSSLEIEISCHNKEMN